MQKTNKPEEELKARSFKEYLESTKESIEVFRWLYREMTTAESKRHMRNLFICLIISVIVQSFQPGSVSYVFDGLRLKDHSFIIGGLTAFLLSLIAQKIIQRFHDQAREWILGIHMGQIDERLSAYFFGKSLAQHAQESHILSPSTIDKGKWKALDVQRILLFDGTATILQLGISIFCLFFLHWTAGIIMATVLAFYILGSLYLNNLVSNVCGPLDREFRSLNRRRFERMEQVERVINNAKEDYEVRNMSAIFEPLIQRDRKFWLWFIDIALIRSGVNIIGLISVMSIGAWLVWKGELSLGLLYPLYSWANRVSENVWRLGDVEHQINWNMPPVKSMIAAVSIPPEIVEPPDAVSIDPTIPHKIEFVEVTHTYRPEKGDAKGTPPAIRCISFTIEPGKKYSLLGGSGAGKSTLMKKLLRYSDPTSGSILIDGIDLRNISLSSWRDGIGYIPQQAQVLDGNIRYNLVYGLSEEERAKVTDEELWHIMRLLKIDFGERLTNGLDTVVGKNGVKLSGGQAQRLMIGAAVIKKPWLLIVDEATSSLDSTTEREVQEGLEAVLAGRNTSALIVAHRLSTVRTMCDMHVVLKPVSSVADGETQVDAIAPDFETLAKQSSIFRRLAADQGLHLVT